MIVLQPDSFDPSLFIPTMPLIIFRSLVNLARGSGDNRFQRLHTLVDMDVLGPSQNWPGFERFCISHTSLMNEFFANDQRKRQSGLPLSWRYAPGYGGAGDIKIEFLSKHSEMYKCSHRFPDEEGESRDFADGNCYHNASGAPFADGFYVCHKKVDINIQSDSDTSEDETDMPEDEVMDDPASEAKDAAAKDEGVAPDNKHDLVHFQPYKKIKLFIAEQYKSIDTSVSFETGIKEHEKNINGWEDAEEIPSKDDHRLITILITTCQVPPPHEKDARKKKELLVIDVTMFKDLFGILAPLVKTDRIAINTLKFSRLETTFNSFGTNMTVKIISAKSNDFTSKSDFKARMAAKGVKIEGEKSEDILNKSDF